jgi:hypothetical protein
MKKPNIFRFIDAISFGMLAAIATSLAIYVHLTSKTDPIPAQAYALLWVVAGSFWLIYGLLIYTRYKSIKQIRYVTRHGLLVCPGQFEVLQTDIENETALTITSWTTATGWEGCRDAIESKPIYVFFKTFPVKTHWRSGLFAGYTIGQTIVVGFKPEIAKTAFAHELGHLIHKKWKGYWSEKECHNFMQEKKLP